MKFLRKRAKLIWAIIAVLVTISLIALPLLQVFTLE
jgi:hypothetical protein